MSAKHTALLTSFILLLFSAAGYFAFMEEQGNFHSITAGEAYRSAQLDRDELEYYLKKYGIKSILNLRGRNPNASWYWEEIEVSATHGVAHFDIPLSATVAPRSEDIGKMIEIFKSAPRPILIHCQAGADRSGLAAAIWKVIVDGRTKKEAAGQLSLLYGHLPVGPTAAMDHYFENWEPSSL